MKKRTFASVTTKDCSCNYLEQASRDNDSPIKFDPKLNEFNFHYPITGGGSGSLRIYHCPFCGGAAPKSLNSTLFATISSSELIRLRELTKDIKTIKDAFSKLGKPDEDDPAGAGINTPEKGGEPPKYETFHSLRYHGLSDVAYIEITDYLRERVHISFLGKCIGQKKELE